MQPRIISGDSIYKIVDDYLNYDEKRIFPISHLPLTEVNAYIRVAEQMRAHSDRNEEFFFKLFDNKHASTPEKAHIYKKTHPEAAPYTKWFFMQMTKARDNTKKVTKLLAELHQQKDHLENVKSMRQDLQQQIISRRLARLIAPSLDDNKENNIEENIKESQDVVALEALNTINVYSDNLKAAEIELLTLRERYSEQKKVLESTLNQVSLLQKDKEALQHLLKKACDINQEAESLREENSRLHLALGHDEKTSPPKINKEFLINLLRTYDDKKSFFKKPDPTLDKLRLLSLKPGSSITHTEIEISAQTDEHRSIFNDPFSRPALSKTEIILRELGFKFRGLKYQNSSAISLN